MPEQTLSGFLNVHKPTGITSHDVVARIRHRLKIKKVGHAGTLDPLASGVLIICVGNATRLSEYAMATTKRYLANIYLGMTTDTYDAEGSVVSTNPIDHITQQHVQDLLSSFTGEIEQLPPMYSAIKHQGKKLYELARAGQEIERTPRRIRIESLEILEWSPPCFSLDVICSSGTYIRSLAYDLGEKLKVGAHLAGLVRVASGNFKLEDATLLSDLLDNPNWEEKLLPMDVVLQEMPSVKLSEVDALAVRQGRAVSECASEYAEFARAYTSEPEEKFFAILRAKNGTWHPHKVFI